MKSLKILLALAFILNFVSLHAQNLKPQKQYFPKCIKKMKIYLGSTEEQLLDICVNCEDQKKGESFRNIYLSNLSDKEFESVVFYVSTNNAEVYEMILVAKDDMDITKIANKLLGEPNAQNGEWRFHSNETGQRFTMAFWVYKNKLIIAGDLKGSEWESGFE